MTQPSGLHWVQQQLQQYDSINNTASPSGGVTQYCPILIDIVHNDKHVTDCMLWNTQQNYVTLRQYVDGMCNELKLDSTFNEVIISAVHQQITQFAQLFTLHNDQQYSLVNKDKLIELSIDIQHKSIHLTDTIILDLHRYASSINTFIGQYTQQVTSEWNIYDMCDIIQYTIHYQLYLDRKQYIEHNTLILKRIDKHEYINSNSVLRSLNEMSHYTTRVMNTSAAELQPPTPHIVSNG